MQKNEAHISWPRALLAIALLLGCIWFIFSNSLLDPHASSLRSDAVAAYLKGIMERFLGPRSPLIPLMQANIRKIAHAVEFFMLGFISALTLAILRRATFHMVLHAILLVLMTAVADESIQLFTSRGAQVQDILLDFFSGLAGCFLVLTIYWFFSRLWAAIRGRE